MKPVILLAISFFIFQVQCFAQKSKTSRPSKTKAVKANPKVTVSEKNPNERDESDEIKKEVSYYAAPRYVIADNITEKDLGLTIPQRRMEVLMLDEQFNRKNLLTLFELIKKRYPEPMHLEIEVHTSIATIETPEEREMFRDSSDSRFAHTHSKYRRASYSRSENGRESFSYTITLSPYKEKFIVLNDVEFN